MYSYVLTYKDSPIFIYFFSCNSLLSFFNNQKALQSRSALPLRVPPAAGNAVHRRVHWEAEKYQRMNRLPISLLCSLTGGFVIIQHLPSANRAHTGFSVSDVILPFALSLMHYTSLLAGHQVAEFMSGMACRAELGNLLEVILTFIYQLSLSYANTYLYIQNFIKKKTLTYFYLLDHTAH